MTKHEPHACLVRPANASREPRVRRVRRVDFARVLRLVGWFVLVFLALHVLRAIPGVGRIFAVPLVGFWLAAIVVSAAGAYAVSRMTAHRRLKGQLRSLGQTDTPHNRGKLGAALLAHGRVRDALPHLEAAVRGEPERLEWRYREACARLSIGDSRAAAAALRELVARDEDHGFGAALLRLSEAELAAGDARAALGAIERFEHARGKSAESAYRRGLAQKQLGRTAEARAAFRDVVQAAREAPRASRVEAQGFAWRARLARLL